MLDIHCHIIPGVDDGAQSMEESISMLDAAAGIGITQIVATPHIEEPHQDIGEISEKYEVLREIARKKKIDLKLGFEVNIHAVDPDDYSDIHRYCIQGTQTLLLEYPFDHWKRYWEQEIYNLQARDITIIIAHPERYRPVQRDFAIIDRMVDMGCLFQLDALAYRHLFSPERKIARMMEKYSLVDYIASDAHEIADYDDLKKGIALLKRRHPGSDLFTKSI